MEIINTTAINTTIIIMGIMDTITMEISIIAIVTNLEMKMVVGIGREAIHGKDRELRKGKVEVTMEMAKIKEGREGEMGIITTIIGEKIQEDSTKMKDGQIIKNKIGIRINIITTDTINSKKGQREKASIIKMSQEMKYLTV